MRLGDMNELLQTALLHNVPSAALTLRPKRLLRAAERPDFTPSRTACQTGGAVLVSEYKEGLERHRSSLSTRC
ncbi:hypothetical protein BaRGS_00000304 [Batillaria attramentaria]|uniref:Uncharacterized protein n=1 Tax=Batillaria attramentaria TaxID=370345 RepID=A0ABD0MBY2_9CAEN